MNDEELICGKCQVALEKRTLLFRYMGHSFNSAVPRCPRCGQVYLPREFVDTKIVEVEKSLEDK